MVFWPHDQEHIEGRFNGTTSRRKPDWTRNTWPPLNDIDNGMEELKISGALICDY